MITKEQLINGVIAYADSEVMPKLPTSGKWLVGSVIVLANGKVNEIYEAIANTGILKPLGIENENGLIDETRLLDAVATSAEKYGSLTFNIPFAGSMTFNANDIHRLRNYMGGQNG